MRWIRLTVNPGPTFNNIDILQNVFSGEYSTVGHWTYNSADDSSFDLDESSFAGQPVALKQKKQVLKVQTVTVSQLVYLLYH